MIENKNILIIGGTGSLGHALTHHFLATNKIYIMSRDENKQWQMRRDFAQHPNLSFIIGNVADVDAVAHAFGRAQPHIIIAAAALKHIDICEYNIAESINTNITGTRNIVDLVQLSPMNVETVLFVSTDKACSPVNNYGMCKAISETIIVEAAHYDKRVKYVVTRYGNVLNTRGSIIPLLHQMGKDKAIPAFTLTDERMTRFVMTLEESVALIEYTIVHGASGEIIVPRLDAMSIKDLVEIFSEIYNKPVVVTRIRAGEKIHETLINGTQAMRTVMSPMNEYKHIQSPLSDVNIENVGIREYTSNENVLKKEKLREYLHELGFLQQ